MGICRIRLYQDKCGFCWIRTGPKRRLNTFLLLFQGLAFHNEPLLLITSFRHTEITSEAEEDRPGIFHWKRRHGLANHLGKHAGSSLQREGSHQFTTQNSGSMAYLQLGPDSIPRAVYIDSTVPLLLAENM
jgi:hypothetical protein